MTYSDVLWENASGDVGVTWHSIIFDSHGTCTTAKKKRGKKQGMRRTYLRDFLFRWLPIRPLPVTRLTSLPVTWLPIAPPNSTTTSEVLSVPIYYYALCVCAFFFWPLYCLWFEWRLQIVCFSERRLLKEAKQFDTLYIREHIVAFFLPVDKVIKYEEYWV